MAVILECEVKNPGRCVKPVSSTDTIMTGHIWPKLGNINQCVPPYLLYSGPATQVNPLQINLLINSSFSWPEIHLPPQLLRAIRVRQHTQDRPAITMPLVPKITGLDLHLLQHSARYIRRFFIGTSSFLTFQFLYINILT